MTYSLGETNITVTTPQVTAEISVHIMPSKILNYNIIGVNDIRRHFLPVLMSKCNKPRSQIVTHPAHQPIPKSDTPCAQTLPHSPLNALSHNLIETEPTPLTANLQSLSPPTTHQTPSPHTRDPEQNITYEQASQLYSRIPMPEAQPHNPPKQLIDILWFQSLWQLFPRLAKEHENLSEPSRLPHDFSIKLKAGAKPHISPTYQMDKRRTTELLLFLQKAIADNLIVATPCKYISASFMVPRSGPNKPYRCKIVMSATKQLSTCNIFFCLLHDPGYRKFSIFIIRQISTITLFSLHNWMRLSASLKDNPPDSCRLPPSRLKSNKNKIKKRLTRVKN